MSGFFMEQKTRPLMVPGFIFSLLDNGNAVAGFPSGASFLPYIGK